MFNDIVEHLRVIVGVHGSKGCTLHIAVDALREVILPRLRIALNPIIGASIFELLRADGHVTAQVEAIIATTATRGRKKKGEPTTSALPNDWPVAMWAETMSSQPSLLSTIRLVPSKTLQSHSCGVPSGAFMRPAMWATLDVLGQHLSHGVARETIKAACDAVPGPSSSYFLSIRDLKGEHLMITCAAIVKGTFRERYFLRVANPCVGASPIHGAFADWLAHIRAAASEDEHDCNSDEDAAPSQRNVTQRVKVEFDNDDDFDENAPLGATFPLRALRHQQEMSMRASLPTGGSVQSVVAIDDDILVRSVNTAGGAITLRGLTRQLLRFYRLPMPENSKKLGVAGTAVASQCRQISALRVIDGPTDSQTIVCHSSRLDEVMQQRKDRAGALTTHDDASENKNDVPRRQTEVSSTTQSTSSVFPASFDPLMPLVPQVLLLAQTKPVLVEQIKPPLLGRNMKQFIPRLRAAMVLPPFAGNVEIRMQRADDRKAFCVELVPSAAAILAQTKVKQETDGVQPQTPPTASGISQWAKTTFRDALKAHASGVMTLDTITEILDSRTIRRLIPVLRAEGSIVTTGLQLPGRRTRVGLVLDADKLDAITEETKQQAAEQYFATLEQRKSKALSRNPLLSPTKTSHGITQQQPRKRGASGKGRSVPSAALTQSEEGSTEKDMTSGVSAEVVSEKWSTVLKAQASFISIANGAAPSAPARCWRLHLELWHIYLRRRHIRRQGTHHRGQQPMLSLREVLEEMSFSTFCVVCGVMSQDLETLMPQQQGCDDDSSMWGLPIRRLPSSLQDLCYSQLNYPVYSTIGLLQSIGALTSDLPQRLIDPQQAGRQKEAQVVNAHILLQSVITSADGQRWPIAASHPTVILANVGLFWALGRIDAPLTSTSTTSTARVRKMCSAVTSILPTRLSLCETYATTQMLRCSFPFAAHLLVRAAGDHSQLASTTSSVGNQHADMNRPSCSAAVKTMMAILLRDERVTVDAEKAGDGEEDETEDMTAASTQYDDGEETSAKDNERVILTGRQRAQSVHRRRKPTVSSRAFNDALHVSVSDDTNWLGALARMSRLLSNEGALGFLRSLSKTLCNLHDAVTLHVPKVTNVQWRHVRLYVLHTMLHPTQTLLTTTFVCEEPASVVAALYASLKRLVNPSRDPKHAAVELLKEHEDLVGILQSVLFSRWDELSTSHREEQLGMYEPSLVKQVCEAMKLVYPRGFKSEPTSSDRHLRLWDLLGVALDDALYHATLRFPVHWERDRAAAAQTYTSIIQATPPSTNEETTAAAPISVKSRDPACALQPLLSSAHASSAPEHSRVPLLRGSCPPAPAWLPQSALTNNNGTLNLSMAHTEVSRLRAVLLQRPGISRDRALDRLTYEGVMSTRAANALIDALIADGTIQVRAASHTCRDHPLLLASLLDDGTTSAATRKRLRGEEDEQSGHAAKMSQHLFWNVLRHTTTVSMNPLAILCPSMSGDSSRVPSSAVTISPSNDAGASVVLQ
ncbi:Hypothetical protein, putative [Bodo saltans]|uniref:Uncharacterized protein n=1 Tax=Bodo saltans TaxID=75058 RepID=A0A0S4JEN7_BODSA|nr:Hypothetical protein, putative [Bodo saltans]|eukprot:CUG88757.1 Hypothetical protein, putative [Bodo saltans]